MGLCRNAVAQKLRSGFEPGKRINNRIVELYKMRPSSTAYVSDVSYGQILKYFYTLNWSTKAAHEPARILQALVTGKACFWGFLRGCSC